MDGPDHAERRKAQFKRRLGDISGIIRTELEDRPSSPEISITFSRDTWQMIRFAIEYSRKTDGHK